MSELRTSLVIDLAGNLQRRAMAAQRAMGGIGRTGTAQFAQMNRQMARSSAGLLTMGRYAAGLLAGVAVQRAARRMMDFDATLRSVGSQAGKTGKDLDLFVGDMAKKLRAKASEFNITGEELADGFRVVMDRVGDLGLAIESLPTIAEIIQGGESTGDVAGEMVAALARNLKLRGRALQEAAERLFTQADKGSLVPRELAPILPRATAAMAATGRTGPGAAAEMGAMLQMFFRATGSAEMTVTAFERFIDTVMSEKAEFLRASGIDPLEPGTRNLRALPAIMDDVLRAAEHTAQKRGVSLGEVLTDVFDVQARRGVQAVAAAPEDLQGFLTMHEPGILARKSRDLALGPGAQMKGVGALLNESIEHAAGPALREAGEFAGRARQQGFRSALEREVAEIEAQHRARGVDTPVSRVPQSVLDAEAAQAGVPRGRLQVDIDVRAEPGLQATPRVRQVPEGIDVDTGPYMPTP